MSGSRRSMIAEDMHAVMDAVRRLGVQNIDMPLTPAKVWMALQEAAK